MQLLPTIAFLLLNAGSTCSATEYANSPLEIKNQSSPASTYSDNDILRHITEIESRLANTPIHRLKKMSADEGEKFFFDYWSFGPESQSQLSEREVEQTQHNDTSGIDDLPSTFFYPRSYPFQPSLPFEANPRNLLDSRDFKCPTGTRACTSIGRSDRCCGTGDTCEHVTDTGSGDVGCCPTGETCSDVVGACPGNETTCSEALGGGCCIPGYECVTGGCVFISVVTVTIHSTMTLSTKTYSTVPQSSLSSSQSTSNTVTTDNLVPPARPTRISTTTQGTTTHVSVCPTGFYACSAVYQGGCCQTGRDCDTTSCPTTSLTTFTSDGVTIVEPVTTASGKSGSGSTRKCATGWFSCADTVGGGCCPSGYTCGSSCTAAASKTTVAKEEATSRGSKVTISWGLIGMSLLAWWKC